SAKLWKTIPNLSRRISLNVFLSAFDKSCPSITILPSVGSINRLTKRIKVDLPLPERPIITKVSPGLTLNEALETPTVLPVFSNNLLQLVLMRSLDYDQKSLISY